MDNGINKLRSFGKFSLDPVKCVLWHDGKPVDLPLKQVELLAVLTENSGEVVTKAELLDRVWQDSFVEESNLSRHIYLLRKMFKEHGEEETLIKTVPRRGYLFTGEIQDLQNTEIIIERHSLTKAVVDLDAGDEFDEPEPASIKPRRRLAAVAGAGVLIIIAAVVIAWYVIPRRAVSVDKVNSIAVLPLRSFSDQEPNSELRIRLTDALITRLGELRKVVVRPTSAVLPFADSAESTIEIGKKLQVDAVVEARLQQEGERLRVTMQMIRTSDGANLWSGQFDGQTGKILDLQDSIADSVSRSLSGAVSDQPEFTKRSTENNDAYEAYLKGRYFWAKREPASLAKAADFFKQAAALDPQFSEAFSGLADTQHLLFSYNIDLRPELIEEAKRMLLTRSS
ncbi:MAG: CadC family transcriptional regulator [Acidobacteria bacterium OLB17]|nr:MAG: CadC family transcriptional regulator [Acidobacteria bacterium OLB17]